MLQDNTSGFGEGVGCEYVCRECSQTDRTHWYSVVLSLKISVQNPSLKMVLLSLLFSSV